MSVYGDSVLLLEKKISLFPLDFAFPFDNHFELRIEENQIHGKLSRECKLISVFSAKMYPSEIGANQADENVLQEIGRAHV